MRIIFVTTLIMASLFFPAKAAQTPSPSDSDEYSIPLPSDLGADIDIKKGESDYKELLFEIADKKGLPDAKVQEIVGTIGGVPNTGCRNGESTWKADAVGDGGSSFGLAQIHIPAHPHITPEQAKDPEFALEFMVDEFLQGNEWKWTCWKEIYG